MNSKVKFAAKSAIQIAAVATFAAYAGAAGAATSKVTLTVKSGQGGVVQSDPYGLISCTSSPQSSTCSANVTAGMALELTETPLRGYSATELSHTRLVTESPAIR